MTNAKNTQKSLPFFGIGKMLPFMKKYRPQIALMMVCGLLGSAMDVSIPLFQRYALNHFVEGQTLDTLPWFLLMYLNS